MKVEVLKRNIFAHNDSAAQRNRELLEAHKVVAVNIMGGPGCGKTTLLERVIPELRERFSVAVLEGDVATTKDAERIAALDVPVIQLLTEGGCHLTATLVGEGLKRLPLDTLDVVIIENVGNPVCPANFDLGEHSRVSVLSVAEGDDKPAKYPYLFKVADVVVVTKMDLLSLTDFDWERALAAIRALDADKPVVAISANDPQSIAELVSRLEKSCFSHAAMQK